MNIEEFCREYSVERRGTGSLKWDSLEEIFGDSSLTPFWLADMEFKVPFGVREAITKLNEHGVFGYGRSRDSYFEAFFSWQKTHHSMELKKEQVRFYTGVVGGLYAVVNSFTNEGDAIIICPPVYYPFYDIILNTKRNLVTSQLVNKDGKYFMNAEDFEKKVIDNNVRAFIICSPHNPISRVWTEEELNEIFAICKKHNVTIISDEIHQDFTYNTKFIPASEVSGGKYRDNLVILNAASKTFNLAGLIHSHTIVFSPELMAKYDAYIKTIGQAEINLFGITAVEAAYRTGEEWLENVKAVIMNNYDFVKESFAKDAPKIVVTPLEGTYLTWIDLRGYIKPEEVAPFVKEKCRLAVDVGEWFDFNGHGFIRINLATDPKYVKFAVNSILENLPK